MRRALGFRLGLSFGRAPVANIPDRDPTRLKRTPVSLFTDYEADRAPRRRGGWIGWTLLALAIAGVAVVSAVPAPYVIEQPGPVFDVLGEVEIDDERTPLIQIPLEPTFPTAGSLDMLTVTISGNREHPPSWFEIIAAHFDPSKAVMPVDAVYPVGFSPEDSAERGRIEMDNSQKEAVAAALIHLGHEIESTLTVVEVDAEGPAAGELRAGDIIVSVNGVTFPDVTGLRERIAENGVDRPADVVIVRDGVESEVLITPELSEGTDTTEPIPVFGILVGSDYDFPFAVTIQLQNVGGPSAGMMFALGIIDKLTPGPLTGGEIIAGTGTISASGEVGPIGGVQQKMHGAVGAGASWFLVPAANCDEVVGNVPSGLTVFAVETLDEALTALSAVRSTGSGAGLPTCEG
jgi:PDZ domain-containing protein